MSRIFRATAVATSTVLMEQVGDHIEVKVQLDILGMLFTAPRKFSTIGEASHWHEYLVTALQGMARLHGLSDEARSLRVSEKEEEGDR
jgi:hypothetical protein